MIIDSLGQEAKTNLKTERASFSVAADKAKKFLHIAVRNLYSNPVLASVVEVSQNAHDEHVRKGIEDKPFVVTIPTSWSPTFSVRDFGGGIPHDYMLDGYTKALESTKDSDSEMSGGWGLGRLALLSLASTYNVTTYIDGVERNYSIFESENGIEIIMTHQRETEEVNGTLVSAPIPPNKVSEFRDACNRAFRYYKIKPTVKGDSGFKIQEPSISLKGSNWAIESNSSKTSAVCGIYHYEIDHKNVPNLTQTQADLLGDVGLVMFFGASDLSPMANRQGLYYNDKTVDAIKKRLNEIETEVATELQKKFTECKSYFEAKKLWGKMFDMSSGHGVNSLFRRSAKLHWNNIPIESDVIDDINKIGKVVNGDPIGIINITSYQFTWSRSRRFVRHSHNERNILISDKTEIFINDLPGGRGAINRAKSFVRGSAASTGIEKIAYTIHFSNDAIKNEFFKITNLSEGDFTKISTIIPTKLERNLSGYERSRCKVFKWNGETEWRVSRLSKCWDISEIDLEEDEEGVYIPIERYKPQGRNIIDTSGMERVINMLKDAKFVDANFEIYGVRYGSEEHNKMKEMEDWISLDELVDSFIKSYKIPDNELQLLADASEAAYIRNSKLGHFLSHEPVDDNLIKQVPFLELKTYLEKIKKIQDAKKECETLKISSKHASFVSLGGSVGSAKTPQIKFEDAEKELTKNFEILDFVSSAWSSNLFLERVLKAQGFIEKYSKKLVKTS